MKSRRSNIVYPEVHVRDVVFFLWRGIRKNWVYMVLIIVGIGAASVFEVIIPLYYKYFFDTLSSGLDKAAIAPKLIRFIFIILGLNGCAWLGWRIGWFSSNKFQAESMASLRQQAYNYLIYHSYSFFTNNFTGALVQRVGRYARAFERL
ncbi:MAG: ABC transporter transmembrane domain-containing protein, partial [Candidatus Liptonbacteria bacterium]|nr:ABC transporter transmembrane domain-containing protein [Candidatus Liptonbacteria bacterium]